jgi:hypothetical protein
MTHTFEIRFDRSQGLAALLATPTNSFRWTGAGRLSIDPQGISVAVQRGLLSLLARNRTRRIAASNLKEVFREGDALRLEFTTDESASTSLLFFAHDRDTAARIVSLLPTTRTVELEHSTNPRARRFRSRTRAWMLAGAIALAGAVVSLLSWRNSTDPAAPITTQAPRPQFDAPPVEIPMLPVAGTDPIAPEVPVEREGVEPFIVDVPMPPLRMPELPRDQVLPVPSGSPAFPIAREQIGLFESEAAALWADYRGERDRLASGSLAAEAFADRLGALELKWWNVTFRILDDRRLDAPELLDLRATLLGAARHWREFLDGYANGIRRGDHVEIATAFDELAIAEELQARGRRYAR